MRVGAKSHQNENSQRYFNREFIHHTECSIQFRSGQRFSMLAGGVITGITSKVVTETASIGYHSAEYKGCRPIVIYGKEWIECISQRCCEDRNYNYMLLACPWTIIIESGYSRKAERQVLPEPLRLRVPIAGQGDMATKTTTRTVP